MIWEIVLICDEHNYRPQQQLQDGNVLTCVCLFKGAPLLGIMSRGWVPTPGIPTPFGHTHLPPPVHSHLSGHTHPPVLTSSSGHQSERYSILLECLLVFWYFENSPKFLVFLPSALGIHEERYGTFSGLNFFVQSLLEIERKFLLMKVISVSTHPLSLPIAITKSSNYYWQGQRMILIKRYLI